MPPRSRPETTDIGVPQQTSATQAQDGLTSLELTPEANLVYRHLLGTPGADVRAMATTLGLSDEAIRHSLDELVDRNLLRSGEGLVAASPRVALASALEEAERDIVERQSRLAQARAAYDALMAEHELSQQRDALIRLTDLEVVRTRLTELAATAQFECLSLNPGKSHSPDAIEAGRPLNEASLARGVSIRCLYQNAVRNDPPSMAYAKWLVEHGGMARTVPMVPMLMVLVDRRTALVPIDLEDSRAGALEVTNPSLVLALRELFDRMWDSGTPMDQRQLRSGEVPTGDELALLRLLSEGHTDEGAARRLGVSVRTVRRLVADLSNRLGASSRFQLGALAITRGWLEVDGTSKP